MYVHVMFVYVSLCGQNNEYYSGGLSIYPSIIYSVIKIQLNLNIVNTGALNSQAHYDGLYQLLVAIVPKSCRNFTGCHQSLQTGDTSIFLQYQ